MSGRDTGLVLLYNPHPTTEKKTMAKAGKKRRKNPGKKRKAHKRSNPASTAPRKRRAKRRAKRRTTVTTTVRANPRRRRARRNPGRARTNSRGRRRARRNPGLPKLMVLVKAGAGGMVQWGADYAIRKAAEAAKFSLGDYKGIAVRVGVGLVAVIGGAWLSPDVGMGMAGKWSGDLIDRGMELRSYYQLQAATAKTGPEGVGRLNFGGPRMAANDRRRAAVQGDI